MIYPPHLPILRELRQCCYLCRLSLKNIPESHLFILEEDKEDRSESYRLVAFSETEDFQGGLAEIKINFLLVDYSIARLYFYDLFSVWLIPELRCPRSRKLYESALILHYTWRCVIKKELWRPLGEKYAEERKARVKKAEKKGDHETFPPNKDDVRDDIKRRRLDCLPTEDFTVEQRLYEYHSTV